MAKKRQRWLMLLALAILTGFLGLNILAYQHAWAMLRFVPGGSRTSQPEALSWAQKIAVLFTGVSLPRPQTNLPPATLAPECQAVEIPGANGIRLGAWFCLGTRTNEFVLLFHGYGGEKSGTLPEAEVFREWGYNVLLVDFRGSGASSEACTTVGYDEAEDVAAAWRWVRARQPDARIILYGQSMGAAAVLRAVHSCGVKPDAIIVESVFDRLLNTVRHRFEAMHVPAFPCAQLLVFWGGRQMGFNAFAHNPADYAASIHCPILFTHGGADPRAHIEEARRVFAAVPGPKQFHEFPALGHMAPVQRYPEEWKTTVRNFLD